MIARWLNRLLGRPQGLTCQQVMDVLQAYLDGEVDAATVHDVTAHLDACGDCLRESEVYRRIKASLAHPSESVDPEVLARLTRFVEGLPS